MTEGLTRRRGGAATSPEGPSSSTLDEPSSSSNPVPRRGLPAGSSSVGNGSATGSAGGAIEGRGKVAYDPRDFEDKGEANQQPKLTLMEEIVLLGLKDKAVSAHTSQSYTDSFQIPDLTWCIAEGY